VRAKEERLKHTKLLPKLKVKMGEREREQAGSQMLTSMSKNRGALGCVTEDV
jgi:hypothetical protein